MRLKRLAIDNFRLRGRLSRKGLVLSFGLASLLAVPLQFARYPNALHYVLAWACLWFLAGALIRRTHDRGKRAWWLLVFFGPQALFLSLSRVIPAGMEDASTIFSIVALLLSGPFLVWGMVEILTVAGQPGANRFGPDPLEESGRRAASEKALPKRGEGSPN